MSLIKYTLDTDGPKQRHELRRTFHYDEHEDKVYISADQDVAPILKSNANWRSWSDGYNSDKSMRRVARIPLIMIEKIKKEHGFDPLHNDNAERLLQLLDDPEYSKFRCSEGTVARTKHRQYFHGGAKPKVEVKLGTD